MATQHDNHDVSAMDYREHEGTYALFAQLIKWGSVGSLVFLLVIGAFTATVSWSFALIVIALMVFVTAKFL